MPPYRPVSETPSWDREETVESRFAPDYKYATAGEIKNLTERHLAKLEGELHTLRMAYVANGRDRTSQVRPGVTICDEIDRLEGLITELGEYFEAVLVD